MEKCPSCNADLFIGQRFCSVCGANIDEYERKRKETSTKIVHCKYCNAEMLESDRVCGQCGRRAVSSTETVSGGLSDFNLEKLEREAKAKALSNHYKYYGFKLSSLYDGMDVIEKCEKDMEHIIIPGTIHMINTNSIQKLNSLKRITFEEGFKTISENAINNCPNLERIDFPASLGYYEGNYGPKVKILSFKSFTEKMYNEVFLKFINWHTLGYYEDLDKKFYSYLKSVVNNYIEIEEGCTIIKVDELIVDLRKYLGADILEYNRANDCTIRGKSLDAYNAASIRYTTPDFIDKIGYSCFSKNKTLKSIYVTDNVISIDCAAFSECKALEEVRLPNGLKEISGRLFFKSSKLEKVNLPPQLKVIGKNAFNKCSKLTTIQFPETLERVEENAFEDCKKIEKAIFSKNVKELEPYAFSNCQSLKEVHYPNINTISRGLFSGCSALEKIDFFNPVEEVEPYAFAFCSNLKSIDLTNATTIGENAFKDCFSLNNITLNEDLETIETFVFSGCESLEKINIENIKKINSYAFNGCLKLEKIVLSNELEKLGEYAFSRCTSLKEVNIPSKVKEIENGTFCGCESLEKVTLNEGLITIGEKAFEGCRNLKYVIIPSSVEEIRTLAFGRNKKADNLSLRVIYIPKDKKYKTLPKGVKVKKYKLEDIEKVKEKIAKIK